MRDCFLHRLTCLAPVVAIVGACHREPESLGSRPVEFIYLNPTAKKVFLPGNFNGWKPTQRVTFGFAADSRSLAIATYGDGFATWKLPAVRP